MISNSIKLATLRLLAFVIDAFALFSFTFILNTAAIMGYIKWNHVHDIMLSFLIIAYFAVWEAVNNGQTPGKVLARIKIVPIENERLGLYDTLLRSTIYFLTPIIIYFVMALCYTTVFYQNELIRSFTSHIYISSLLAIPLTVLFTKGSCGIHDVFSGTIVIMARKENYLEQTILNVVKKRTAATVYILLILVISISFSQLRKIAPSLEKTNDYPKDRYPLMAIDNYVIEMGELATSFVNAGKYIDIDKVVIMNLPCPNPVTFIDSPLPFDKLSRNVSIDPGQVLCYEVPVTMRGILSADAQQMVAIYISRKVGNGMPIMIIFCKRTSTFFFEVIFKDAIVIMPKDNRIYIVDPDNASSVNLQLRTPRITKTNKW